MTDTQPTLFDDPPQQWQVAGGIGGFVAFANGLATESWNTPSVARQAAQDGKVSKKWYREHVALQAARKAAQGD